MKRSFYLALVAVALTLVVGGTGCKMKPKSPTPIPKGQTGAPGGGDEGLPGGGRLPDGTEPSGGVRPGPTTSPGDSGTKPGDVPVNPSEMKEDANFFKADIVYFAFDRSDVRSGERSKIENVAGHLKSNPTHKVRVEGHCDERGTEGYNLNLGERRALAVREYLMNLGIASDRIATLSYGEARPAMPGHNEAAWAKNRRDEFILLTP
jgi:peptidoglycan-associated lipoprotein